MPCKDKAGETDLKVKKKNATLGTIHKPPASQAPDWQVIRSSEFLKLTCKIDFEVGQVNFPMPTASIGIVKPRKN